jgi:lipoprotein signal peptidase
MMATSPSYSHGSRWVWRCHVDSPGDAHVRSANGHGRWGRVRMKRALYLATGLLVLDQITKGLAAHFFSDRSLLLTSDWGLVYVVNYGLWVKASLPSAYIPLLQMLAALLLIIAGVYLLFYQRFYRKSLWSDLAYACLVAGVLGNVIVDRLLFGYVRDFIVTPIATANLADIYADMVWIAIILEVIAYPPARRLLRVGTPAQWRREVRLFVHFSRHQMTKRRWLHPTKHGRRGDARSGGCEDHHDS